jgi:hypothetical protein
MAQDKPKPFIRNVAEVPWREFPNHFGGALSKPLGRCPAALGCSCYRSPSVRVG